MYSIGKIQMSELWPNKEVACVRKALQVTPRWAVVSSVAVSFIFEGIAVVLFHQRASDNLFRATWSYISSASDKKGSTKFLQLEMLHKETSASLSPLNLDCNLKKCTAWSYDWPVLRRSYDSQDWPSCWYGHTAARRWYVTPDNPAAQFNISCN